MGANDASFADVHALIDPAPPAHDPLAFGPRGKIYDGWETRRRRTPGSDWAVVRLAAPTRVRGLVVDTAFFSGNYPPAVSVEGTTMLGHPPLDEVLAAGWTVLVDHARIAGNTRTVLPLESADRPVTHVRLTMHPDGGIARLRVHGEVLPEPLRLTGRIDVAAAVLGGTVTDCSNMFYGSPANVLAPGVARVMSDGWETARRRDAGHDWLVVRPLGPSVVDTVVIDTTRFVFNAPGEVRVTDADTGAELLPRTPLVPDCEHHFPSALAEPVSRVRVEIFPDGGLSRVRLLGTLTEQARRGLAAEFTSHLTADQIAAGAAAGRLPRSPDGE